MIACGSSFLLIKIIKNFISVFLFITECWLPIFAFSSINAENEVSRCQSKKRLTSIELQSSKTRCLSLFLKLIY